LAVPPSSERGAIAERDAQKVALRITDAQVPELPMSLGRLESCDQEGRDGQVAAGEAGGPCRTVVIGNAAPSAPL
jgi:hypothetical protein